MSYKHDESVLEEGVPEEVDVVVLMGDGGEPSEVMTEEEAAAAEEHFTEGHNANLALGMDSDKRGELCAELEELVEQDDESRAEWRRRLVDGLTLLGVKDIPEDELPFPRATRVNHPVLADVMVQFQARAIEEYFPASGPVKGHVVGKQTEYKIAQADRVEQYMNYHLTEKDREYFEDTDQMLFYEPYSGSVFRKSYYDMMLGMPVNRYVKAENFVVPYEARSLASAPRYAEIMDGIPINDIKRLQSKGIYVEYEIDEAVQPTGTTKDSGGKELEDDADKREPTTNTTSSTLRLIEVTIDLEAHKVDPEYASHDDFKLPYIVLLDPENGEVLSIRRNWKEDDQDFRKRIWYAHYKYLPGLGFYGWGILHIIGSLGAAATGAVRALLDTALRANNPGGFKAKELATVAGDFTIDPGVWKDVDIAAEDLARGFYTPPSPHPNPALFELLKVLLEGARQFASITEALVGEASNTGPVGTTVALIEQSMKVFSGIHKRNHAAARQEFKMLAELIHETMPESYDFETDEGTQTLRKQDFDGRVDVLPVSDPNIFSSVQRIAIAQAVFQVVNDDQHGQFDSKSVYEATKRLFEALRVPDIDEILPDKESKRLDPVSENQNMLIGKPVRAFIDQHHQAHIQVHEAFGEQLVNLPEEVSGQVMPVLMAHLMQHAAYQYRLELQQQLLEMTGEMMPPYDMNDRDERDLPPEIENRIAEMTALIINQNRQQQEEEAQQEEEPTEEELAAQQAEEQALQEQERKNQSFQMDQERKNAAFQADQQRKQQAEDAKQQNRVIKAITDAVNRLRGRGTPSAAKKPVPTSRDEGGDVGG